MRAAFPPRGLPVAVAGAVGLAALAWFDLWRRAAAMAHNAGMGTGTGMGSGMSMAMAMPSPMLWNVPDLVAAAAMWSVMMIAMMLPSAMPMLLFFSAAQRSRRAPSMVAMTASLFAAGFLLCWLAWSCLAAGLQWSLQALLVLSPQLTVVRAPLAAAILVVAGLYQFTPLKHACLARCQSPLSFLLTQWRDGPWGAVRMGMRYGAYCVGCCWALMALLFVVGVMNLMWIALLAIFVLIEKTTVRGPWLGRATGAALIAWAVYLLAVAPSA